MISREVELDLSRYLSETVGQLAGVVSDPHTRAPEAAYTAELLKVLSELRAMAAAGVLSGKSNITPQQVEDLKGLLMPLKTSSIRASDRLHDIRGILDRLQALRSQAL